MYFCQKTTKKRVGGCPAVNHGRCSYEDTPDNYVELLVTPDVKKVSVNSDKVTNKPSVTSNIPEIRTRIVYNSNVLRKTVEGLLVYNSNVLRKTVEGLLAKKEKKSTGNKYMFLSK